MKKVTRMRSRDEVESSCYVLLVGDEPENVVRVLLRQMDQKIDRLGDDVGDLKVRMSAVESQIGNMQAQIGTINGRLDRVDGRRDRIEKRLDLVEV